MQYNLPTRKKTSHKGEVGKVLIIGGSSYYYGAPILSALGAEKSGADLITLMIPKTHHEVAKKYSLNLFLKSFTGDMLSLDDVEEVFAIASHCHALLIGPGVGADLVTQNSIVTILQKIDIPVILDAQALFPQILSVVPKNSWTIKPHRAEFSYLFGCEANENNISEMARKHKMQIIVKGHTDIIADKDGILSLNDAGCPEMRVGGTGDALAGIITSWVAQGMSPDDACKSAVFYFCSAADKMRLQSRHFSSCDLVEYFPRFLASYK